jgi:5-methylthioribose kinase
VRELWAAFVDAIARLWPEGEPWRAAFVGSALADAAGYMGMEMIRRIVGLAHVEDVDALAPRPRLRAQHAAIEGARELVLGGPVRSIEDLWTRATEEGAST